MESQPLSLTEEALFRHQVVSEVETGVRLGMTVSAAIAAVVTDERQDLRGRSRRLTERTVYRWLAAFRSHGVRGLEPAPRQRVATSEALSRDMLSYLKAQKLLDSAASVPEVIRRAQAHGVVSGGEVSRTSAWRACKRMGLSVKRPRRLEERDMRRHSQPHRMMTVLADGKHFRAGKERLRRVALPMLDDSTRYGLRLVVGTSECTELFLATLYQAILHCGLMLSLFLDNGPGFVSSDTRTVVAELGIQLIHGSPGYPQGHGKVERFHRRLNEQVLRGLDGNPTVDPDPAALTLRLSHWLDEVYNHDPHHGLDGDSPRKRWESDERALVYPEEGWQRHFVITGDRKVSNDNVISYDGVAYEAPRGHAGELVPVSRHLLDGNSLTVVHQGKAVKLAPVDPVANARSRRARPALPGVTAAQTPPTTAADTRFNTDFQPLVDADGGYSGGDDDDQ